MALSAEQRKRLQRLLKLQEDASSTGERDMHPKTAPSGHKEKATPGSLSPKIRTEAAHTTNLIKGTDYV